MGRSTPRTEACKDTVELARMISTSLYRTRVLLWGFIVCLMQTPLRPPLHVAEYGGICSFEASSIGHFKNFYKPLGAIHTSVNKTFTRARCLHLKGTYSITLERLEKVPGNGMWHKSGICFYCSSFDQYGFSETYAAIDHAPENPLRVKAKKLDQQAQKLDVSHSCEYLRSLCHSVFLT